MTFQMMLSEILLSMLMILLLSILSVMRNLACGNNLKLIYKTLWTGARSGLLISMLGKQLVSFDWSNNTVSFNLEMYGSVLEEKSSFKMLGLIFSSKLDWGS